MNYTNWLDYEKALLVELQHALEPVAQVVSNQKIVGNQLWEIDLLGAPFHGEFGDVPHILEFKYSASPTLPSSVVSQVFHKFAMLDLANRSLGTRFALVTNAVFPRDFPVSAIGARTRVFDRAIDPTAVAQDVLQWMTGSM